MFLFSSEPETPPLLISILTILMLIALVYFIVMGAYSLIKYYIDLFVNKKYYNRNLLILASKIIKADGVINKIEEGFVRKYFIKNFGERKAKIAFTQLKKVTLDKLSTEETSKKVSNLLTYQERFDFVKFLFGIAFSDGTVSSEEELEVRKIASYLYLRKKDYEYLRSIFIKNSKNRASSSNYQKAHNYYYETIGLSKSATNLEVKKAYRVLVKKYHPDKLKNETKEDLIVAKEKFQKIQEAYEKIKRLRKI